MADFNKVFLIGRLTQKPELRYTPSSAPVSDLRLATSRSFSTKDGQRREETLYIDVTVWNRQAENCCQYLDKGSQVHVEGHLRMDSWEDRNTGEKRTKYKVEGERVQFLDSRRSDDSGQGPSSRDDVEYDAPPPRRHPRSSRGSVDFDPQDNDHGRPPQHSSERNSFPAGGDSQEEDIPF